MVLNTRARASARALGICTCLSVMGGGMSVGGAEQAGPWKVLFDGKSLEAWRGFKKDDARPRLEDRRWRPASCR